jgi:pimeloyl-ACP methyl ester carboxylesterase
MGLLVVALVAGLLALALLAGAFIRAEAEVLHPPEGAFLDLPEGRLHYTDDGPRAASAILLLHGASSNLAELRSTLGPLLSPHARVIALDRPGLGWSERMEGRAMADPARQAAVVAIALGALGVTGVVVVAHSLAGAAATRLALDRPDLVKGLVLLSAVTHPWPGGVTWYYTPAAHPVIGPLFNRLVAIPFGRLLIQRSAAGVFEPQTMPAGYVDQAGVRLVLRPASFAANAEDVTVMKAFVTAQAPRYRDLAMPVVAIAGTEDETVWTDIHTRAIAREAPHGRAMALPGVGHMPHHVVPDLIARETLALLRDPA